MDPAEGMARARELIAIEAKEKTGFLDLGCLALAAVPNELYELTHLRHLAFGPVYTDPDGEVRTSANTSSADTSVLSHLYGDEEPPSLNTFALMQLELDRLPNLVILEAQRYCPHTQIVELPLSGLNNLQSIECSNIQIADLTPLAGLNNLQSLDCSDTQVADLTPLAGLNNLQSLNCFSTQVADLTPLSGLNNLQSLNCSDTQVADLTPLAGLKNLQSLRCWSTQVADLTPIAGLTNLQSLDCAHTQVVDLTPLAELNNLQLLNCSSTQVAELTPLAGLDNLQSLDCSGTEVAELTPLAGLEGLNCSYTKVANLTLLAGLDNLQSLDCSGTEVAELTPLAGLDNLQLLNCSSTQVAELTPLAGLDNLQSLDCSGTEVADLTPLAELNNLQSLDCSRTQIAELTPLAGLDNLQSLDCRHNQIADLTPLAGLKNLQSLTCFHTQVADLTPLAGLDNLQSLDCSGTEVADLTPLAELNNLQSLDCSHTQIAELTPLAGLDNLQSLDCRHNQIADLTPLAALNNLQSLYCSNTQVADLTPLAGLDNLQSLTCFHTQVVDLTPLAGLNNLRSLDCSATPVIHLNVSLATVTANNCHLADIPIYVLDHPRLEELYLHDSTVAGIPTDVLSESVHDNCLSRIRSHFHDLGEGDVPIRDLKLILLGNGRAGKTQICRRLQSLDFDESVKSTHGIEIQRVSFDTATILNIWDFGGQDIYHGTHALFTRSHAVFLIVWNPDSEELDEYEHEGLRFRNNRLSYWLDYVHHLGGQHSPVVVVQSQCDRPEQEVANAPAQIDAFGFGFCRRCSYSAKHDRGRASLDEALSEAIAHIRKRAGIATIGAGRAQVQETLLRWRKADADRAPNERKHRLVSLAAFTSLCETVDGTVTSPTALLAYLHNVGTVFYDEEMFGQSIILDQAWALEAVYTLFERGEAYRRLRQIRGRFTRSLLDSIAWGEYTVEEQELFLYLMQSCRVCFPVTMQVPGQETEYVAPDLLPDRAEIEMDLETHGWRDDKPDVLIDTTFEFLHQGVIRSIIASIGRQALTAGVYWNRGVWVYERDTRASAVIEQHGENCIRIAVNGDRAMDLARSLYEACRHDRAWTSQQETAVYQHGDRLGADESKRILQDARSNHLDVAERKLDPPEKKEKLREREPFVFARRPTEPRDPRIFVSYSWKDKTPVGQRRTPVVDQLCDAMSKRGIDIKRDKDQVGAGDSIKAFMDDLADADCIIAIISNAYIDSFFCMYELQWIYRNVNRDPVRLRQKVVPILLPDAKIDALEDRLTRQLHWVDRSNTIQTQVKKLGEFVTDNVWLESTMIQDFARDTPDILAYVADVAFPRDLDRQADEGFQEIVELILQNSA